MVSQIRIIKLLLPEMRRGIHLRWSRSTLREALPFISRYNRRCAIFRDRRSLTGPGKTPAILPDCKTSTHPQDEDSWTRFYWNYWNACLGLTWNVPLVLISTLCIESMRG